MDTLKDLAWWVLEVALADGTEEIIDNCILLKECNYSGEPVPERCGECEECHEGIQCRDFPIEHCEGGKMNI